MRIRIEQRGVHDHNGVEIPIGTEIEVHGDTIPGWLVNKGIIVADTRGKTPVTNPSMPSPKKAE